MKEKAKRRGRSVRYPMPDKIPDIPENVLKAVLATPPEKRDKWDYVKKSGWK